MISRLAFQHRDLLVAEFPPQPDQIGGVSSDPLDLVARRLVVGFDRHLARLGARSLDVTTNHALLAGSLEWSHRDPFDRMLAAQSMFESIALITKDPAPVMARHSVERFSALLPDGPVVQLNLGHGEVGGIAGGESGADACCCSSDQAVRLVEGDPYGGVVASPRAGLNRLGDADRSKSQTS